MHRYELRRPPQQRDVVAIDKSDGSERNPNSNHNSNPTGQPQEPHQRSVPQLRPFDVLSKHLQQIIRTTTATTSTTSPVTTLDPMMSVFIDSLTSSPEDLSQENFFGQTTSEPTNQHVTGLPQREPRTRNLTKPALPKSHTMNPTPLPPSSNEQRNSTKNPPPVSKPLTMETPPPVSKLPTTTNQTSDTEQREPHMQNQVNNQTKPSPPQPRTLDPTPLPPLSDEQRNLTKTPPPVSKPTPNAAAFIGRESNATQSPNEHLPIDRLLDTLHRTSLFHTHVNHHKSFLQRCLADNMYPKGLTIELVLQAKAPTQSLLEKWNQTLTQTSLKLTELLQNHYESIAQETNNKITNITENIHIQLTTQTLADKFLPIIDQHSRTADKLAADLLKKEDKILHNLRKHELHRKNNTLRLNVIRINSYITKSSKVPPTQTLQNRDSHLNTWTSHHSELTPHQTPPFTHLGTLPPPPPPFTTLPPTLTNPSFALNPPHQTRIHHPPLPGILIPPNLPPPLPPSTTLSPTPTNPPFAFNPHYQTRRHHPPLPWILNPPNLKNTLLPTPLPPVPQHLYYRQPPPHASPHHLRPEINPPDTLNHQMLLLKDNITSFTDALTRLLQSNILPLNALTSLTPSTHTD